jgi:hypothetical protein
MTDATRNITDGVDLFHIRDGSAGFVAIDLVWGRLGACSSARSSCVTDRSRVVEVARREWPIGKEESAAKRKARLNHWHDCVVDASNDPTIKGELELLQSIVPDKVSLS